MVKRWWYRLFPPCSCEHVYIEAVFDLYGGCNDIFDRIPNPDCEKHR